VLRVRGVPRRRQRWRTHSRPVHLSRKIHRFSLRGAPGRLPGRTLTPPKHHPGLVAPPLLPGAACPPQSVRTRSATRGCASAVSAALPRPNGDRLLPDGMELGDPRRVGRRVAGDLATGRANSSPRRMQERGSDRVNRHMPAAERPFFRYASLAWFILVTVIRASGRLRRTSDAAVGPLAVLPAPGASPDDHLPDSLSRQLRGRRDRLAGVLPE
jgi:hypothetical protein